MVDHFPPGLDWYMLSWQLECAEFRIIRLMCDKYYEISVPEPQVGLHALHPLQSVHPPLTGSVSTSDVSAEFLESRTGVNHTQGIRHPQTMSRRVRRL